MEIQELWRVVTQRWRVVFVVTLVCIALALAWSWASPVRYQAKGRIVIATSGSLGTANDAFSGEQVSVERAPTYAQLLKGPEVASRASRHLQGSISADVIQQSIDAKINSRLPLLDVTSTSPSAHDAVLMVAAAELGLQQYVSEIERPGRDGSLTSVVLSGDVPSVVRLGNPIRNAVLASLIGLALGVLLATYRDRTDPLVRSVGQLARAGPIYCGTIAADEDLSAVTEAFQRLAARCLLANDNAVSRILVVGVDESCDSRFIADGLASGLAAFGRKVTLVDAISAVSADPDRGLSDVIDGTFDWSECRIRKASRQQWVMHAGTKGADLDALLINGTDTKERLPISSPNEHIVIAGPSITRAPLGIALTAVADGVLMVAKADVSYVADVIEARATLEAMEVPAIGIVLQTGTQDNHYAPGESEESARRRSRQNNPDEAGNGENPTVRADKDLQINETNRRIR